MAHSDLSIELDLDIGKLAAPGRKSSEPLLARVVRPLEASDLVALAANRGTAPMAVKRLSQRHHGLARSLAAGMAPGEAAIVHGYDPSRVSILQGDPAFEELVEFYSDKVDTAFVEVVEHLAGLSHDAISELQTRLEDAPEDFSNKELLGLMEATLDRTGHGKQSMQVSVTADLTTRINAARERALKSRIAEADATIEATAVEVFDVAAE
jgi:hypothetical protein